MLQATKLAFCTWYLSRTFSNTHLQGDLGLPRQTPKWRLSQSLPSASPTLRLSWDPRATLQSPQLSKDSWVLQGVHTWTWRGPQPVGTSLLQRWETTGVCCSIFQAREGRGPSTQGTCCPPGTKLSQDTTWGQQTLRAGSHWDSRQHLTWHLSILSLSPSEQTASGFFLFYSSCL